MKLFNKSVLLCLTISLLSLASPIYAETTIKINGSTIASTADSYINNGITMVPLRAISEGLGAKVVYDAPTKGITITGDGTTISLVIDRYAAKVNGTTLVLAQKPVAKNGVTFVPLRFIGEALGCIVDYNSKLDLITITGRVNSSDTETKPPVVANVDAVGRAKRTTNLPKNADLFPYIAEGVPNWCYEQVAMHDNFWGSHIIHNNVEGAQKATRLPRDVAGTGSHIANVIYEEYDRLTEIINAQLNIDYRTISDATYANILADGIDYRTVDSDVTSKQILLNNLKDWQKYYKDNKIITKAEIEILPETAWTNTITTNCINFAVKVKLEYVSKDSGLFNLYGGNYLYTATNLPDKTTIKPGTTYEGIMNYQIQYNKDDRTYRLDYGTMCSFTQLNPAIDLLNGVAPTLKDAKRINSFNYSWTRAAGKYFTRYECCGKY